MARRSGASRIRIDPKQILLALLGTALAALVIFVAGYYLGQKIDPPAGVLATVTEPVTQTPRAAANTAAALEEFSFFDELETPAARGKVRRLPRGNANNSDKVNRAKERRAERRRGVKRKLVKPRRLARMPSPGGAVASAAASPTPRQVVGTVQRAFAQPPSMAVKPAPEKIEGSPRFTVQVASFTSFDESSALVRKLRAKGMPAHVVLGSAPEGKIYRVRVGRHQSRDAAQGQVTKLRSQGLAPVITRL
jgi:cell division septation protein DedD